MMDEKKFLMEENLDNTQEAKDDTNFRSTLGSPRPKRPICLLLLIYSLVICFALTSFCLFLPSRATQATNLAHRLHKYAVAVEPGLLQDFQVYPPVLTPTSQGLALTNGSADGPSVILPDSKGKCVVEQTLMKHSFGNSFGQPFVGPYTPPDCDFNRITFNMTVISAGRQFDRLAFVFFGNTELWRTSTAEPSTTGIEYIYIKDMSNYLAHFKKPQKLIFDLGNGINSMDTAPYNVTLKASFFTADDTVDAADKIIPVSNGQGPKGMQSTFMFPPMKAINTLTLPQNVRKAFFTISATGQIDEEFWFGNVLQSDVDTFGQGVLLGHSPFREVQLFIDGMMAGVAWPFPIIFTGGVVPGLWRPIVGIDAFDLKEEEVDITPWLPLLCDGNSHTFELKVAGIENKGHGNGHLNHTIGSYWQLSGKIFLWLDPEGSITTGSDITQDVPKPFIQLTSHITKTPKGKNQTLKYSVGVQRALRISSSIKTASGTEAVFWTQNLTYSNEGLFDNHGDTSETTQLTGGEDMSSSGYTRQISYPINVKQIFKENPKTKSFSIDATIARGQNIIIQGTPVFPTGLQSFNPFRTAAHMPPLQGTNLETFQNGSATFFENGKNTMARSSGTLQQDINFQGFRLDKKDRPATRGNVNLYQRHVVAVNATVITDEQALLGQPFGSFSAPRSSVGDGSGVFAVGTARKLIGYSPPEDQ